MLSRLRLMALLTSFAAAPVVQAYYDDDHAYNTTDDNGTTGNGDDALVDDSIAQQYDDAVQRNDDAAQQNDEAAAQQNDDAAEQYDDAAEQYDDTMYQDNEYFSAGDASIKYWTDYAILTKRCIVYNEVDVIVFSLHNRGYKQCSDEPVGTYITPVQNFLDGYLKYNQRIQQDKGFDDYDHRRDVANYAYCTRMVNDENEYWMQVGCAENTSQALAVKIYSDNNCTKRSFVGGYDDSANVDISEIQPPFKKCEACVTWIDQNDDNPVEDNMYYENRRGVVAFCATAWNYKAICNRDCQKIGIGPRAKYGWSTPDKIVLAILSFVCIGMLLTTFGKRQKMSNRDALLEQAAMKAVGLKKVHVIGTFVFIVIMIIVFALLQLKNITWAMLLILNTALFCYLIKLAFNNGLSEVETVIGTDGSIMREADSDDARVNSNAGTYMSPVIA